MISGHFLRQDEPVGLQTCNLRESTRQRGDVLLLAETNAAAGGSTARQQTQTKMQNFMKSKLFVPRAIAVLASLALAGLVTAATLGSRTPPLAADGKDPTERNITRMTAGLLEHSQFSHHRLDDELAARFLDRYLDSLDPAHLLFLQSDAQEFDVFRSRLPELTRREGDLTPARAIFQRYLERLDQRVAYVTNLLQSEKFDFTGHDTYSFDREKAARPRGPSMPARELWRQNVRAEYLQEKLAGKKPADIITTLTRRYTPPVADHEKIHFPGSA